MLPAPTEAATSRRPSMRPRTSSPSWRPPSRRPRRSRSGSSLCVCGSSRFPRTAIRGNRPRLWSFGLFEGTLKSRLSMNLGFETLTLTFWTWNVWELTVLMYMRMPLFQGGVPEDPKQGMPRRQECRSFGPGPVPWVYCPRSSSSLTWRRIRLPARRPGAPSRPPPACATRRPPPSHY